MPEPVRFDHWMDRRLYGPDGFYEVGGQAGRRGDFITSPEVGPLFGLLVGRALDRWWDELGRPDPYVFVEAGAGRGALAITVLRSELRCREALRYVTVERSAALRTAQTTTVPDGVEIRSEWPDQASVVFANELLDNLAFRLFERVDDGWCEVWVAAHQPVLHPVNVLPPALTGIECEVGTRLPWFERAASWVDGARRRAAGVACVDYAIPRTDGLLDRSWLRTYQGHETGHDPFGAIAPTDITADVALDQLPGPIAAQTQAAWLASLGIDELVAFGDEVWARSASVPDLHAFEMRSRRREAEALLDPTGLGGFLVVEWSRA